MTTTVNASTVSGTSAESTTKTGSPDVLGDVKEIAGEAAGQVKGIADHQIALRKDKALDTLGHVAQALRETGGRLGSQKETAATDYVLRAADGVDKVAQYVRSRDLVRVVRDVESFARREPAIFLGGAFVAGLIGSRFLKSSAAHPQEAQEGRRRERSLEMGSRSVGAGTWPSEGESGTRNRPAEIAPQLPIGAFEPRNNSAQSQAALPAGSSARPPTTGSAGGSSATSARSGAPVVKSPDARSTQSKTPPQTQGHGGTAPQGGSTGAATTQGDSSPPAAGSAVPQGKP